MFSWCVAGIRRVLSEVPVTNKSNGARCLSFDSLPGFTKSHSKSNRKYFIWIKKYMHVTTGLFALRLPQNTNKVIRGNQFPSSHLCRLGQNLKCLPIFFLIDRSVVLVIKPVHGSRSFSIDFHRWWLHCSQPNSRADWNLELLISKTHHCSGKRRITTKPVYW